MEHVRSTTLAEHGRVEKGGGAAPVELSGAAAVPGCCVAGGGDEADRSSDLAVEVPGVERYTPYDLVDPVLSPDLITPALARLADGRP